MTLFWPSLFKQCKFWFLSAMQATFGLWQDCFSSKRTRKLVELVFGYKLKAIAWCLLLPFFILWSTLQTEMKWPLWSLGSWEASLESKKEKSFVFACKLHWLFDCKPVYGWWLQASMALWLQAYLWLMAASLHGCLAANLDGCKPSWLLAWQAFMAASLQAFMACCCKPSWLFWFQALMAHCMAASFHGFLDFKLWWLIAWLQAWRPCFWSLHSYLFICFWYYQFANLLYQDSTNVFCFWLLTNALPSCIWVYLSDIYFIKHVSSLS